MPGWLVTGFVSLAAGALSLRGWYRWQQGRQVKRVLRALGEGDVQEVALLLAEGVDPAFIHERLGEPALVVAIRAGCGVELLLARGADPDERGPGWMTPLMHAAASGDEQHCRMLLEGGADADARDLFGRPAAWWAEQSGATGVVRLLREGVRRALS